MHVCVLLPHWPELPVALSVPVVFPVSWSKLCVICQLSLFASTHFLAHCLLGGGLQPCPHVCCFSYVSISGFASSPVNSYHLPQYSPALWGLLVPSTSNTLHLTACAASSPSSLHRLEAEHVGT